MQLLILQHDYIYATMLIYKHVLILCFVVNLHMTSLSCPLYYRLAQLNFAMDYYKTLA